MDDNFRQLLEKMGAGSQEAWATLVEEQVIHDQISLRIAIIIMVVSLSAGFAGALVGYLVTRKKDWWFVLAIGAFAALIAAIIAIDCWADIQTPNRTTVDHYLEQLN